MTPGAWRLAFVLVLGLLLAAASTPWQRVGMFTLTVVAVVVLYLTLAAFAVRGLTPGTAEWRGRVYPLAALAGLLAFAGLMVMVPPGG